ncbi:MAG: adenosine deaminase [Nocardioides sp.]|uniref:adenosine deaminase n=1 Tax=Nocardioides sp. TaxID=35761 RepID=UPI0039E53FE0
MVHPPTLDQIRSAPKVVLHDHLDGGVRPVTIVELAAEIGHELPAGNPVALEEWFWSSADSGSLERYLETFVHTLAVMQDADAIARVARECVEDLADDGVVYAEVRYAPELHVEQGLSLEEVVAAVQRGFTAGMSGRGIVVRQLLTAMRQAARAREIAELAVAWRDRGVAGFDIAGPEKGFPPTRFLDAFEYLAAENMRYTIHAGEGFGLPSIWEAVHPCGADRLGHGVRIVEDITVGPDGTPRLGRLAAYVRDRRIPLEMCPASNVQTGAAPSIAEHPIRLLKQLGFRVTINTDNRLMSRTSMTAEMRSVVEAFDWTLTDLEWLSVNAMKSAFLPYDERVALIHRIKDAYAALA